MSNIFIAYVAAFLLPLLFHSWRVAVLSLGAQGMLMGLILVNTHNSSTAVSLEAFNLFVVRGVLLPWLLLRTMRGITLPSDFTLIKKSALQWVLAFVLVLLAFGFGWKMSAKNPTEALQLGTAAAAILIGVLVLANQSHVLGQLVGLLTFEGGLTLVELISPHAMPLKAYLGDISVYVVLVLTCTQYVRKLAIPPTIVANSEDKVVL